MAGKHKLKTPRKPLAVLLGLAMLLPLSAATTSQAVTTGAGPDPYATVHLEKAYDGTGHGTSSACGLNDDSGFRAGDNTDDDDVVCSGDTVGYTVTIDIAAGPARDILVTIPNQTFLTVSGSSLCTDGAVYTAKGTDTSCTFSVREGAVATIERDVVANAANTGGTRREVTLAANVYTSGYQTAPWSKSVTETVTVISAPAADAELSAPSAGYDQTTAGKGRLTVTTKALTPAGSATTKGATTSGSWSGQLDVSAFPAGTKFTRGAITFTVSGGKIPLSASGGTYVDVQLPAGSYPTTSTDAPKEFIARLLLEKSAYSVGGTLNLGDGSQPGEGLSCTTSSADPATGARAGASMPNNDCARLTFVGTDFVVGTEFSSQIWAPADAATTVFEAGNKTFTADGDVRRIDTSSAASRRVAPDTELDSRVILFSSNFPAKIDRVAVCQMWDPSQRVDTARSVKVVDRFGRTMHPSNYQVQWSAAVLGGSCPDITDTAGWNASPSTAMAVRVIFATGAIKPGQGDFTLTVPLKSLSSYPAQDDGKQLVVRTTALSSGSSFGDSSVLYRDSTLTLPKPLVPTLTKTTTTPSVGLGQPVVYDLSVGATNLATAKQVITPTVVDTLDRCAVEPTLGASAAKYWNMAVSPATPGTSGRVCGDPTSTPAKLTFTVKTPGPAGAFDASTNTGEIIPTIRYTVRASLLTNSVNGPYPFGAAATATVQGGTGTATSSAAVTVERSQGRASAVAVDQPKHDLGDDVVWTVDISDRPDGTGVAPASTVIVLPHNGDGVLLSGVSNPGAYTGPASSSLSGAADLKSVKFAAGHTSAGVSAFITADAPASFGAGDYNWCAVSSAGVGACPSLGDATAVRIDLPVTAGSPVATARVEVTVATPGSQVDDLYLLWAGGIDQDGAEVSGAPWPVATQMVVSSVAGKVWWDESRDGLNDATEPGVDNVTVKLFPVAADGTVSATALRTKTTTAGGTFDFAGLKSGRYVVGVTRGAQIPASVVSHYGETMPVDMTYSYVSRYGTTASETSDPFTLDLDTDLTGVNFAFFSPAPLVALDKSQAVVAGTGSLQQVTWDVDVANTGNLPIKDATIFDRMSSQVFDVRADLTIGRPNTYTQVSAGQYSVAAVDADGAVWTWRSSLIAGSPETPTKVTSPGLPKMVQVEAGSDGSTLARDIDGNLWGWGSNAYGVLGLGASSTVTYPQKLTQAHAVSGGGSLPKFVSVDTAPGGWDMGTGQASVALDVNGDVWVWGRNYVGQLGDGTTVDKDRPAKLTAAHAASGGTLPEFSSVSAGNGFVLAIDTTGRLWGWGLAGGLGVNAPTHELENGGYRYIARPILHKYADAASGGGWLPAFESVSAGTLMGLTIDASGAIWSFGDNGTIGSDGAANVGSGEPVKLLTSSTGAALPRFTAVQSAHTDQLAIDAAGNLWGWGRLNGSTNVTADRPTKMELGGLTTFTDVTIGGAYKDIGGRDAVISAVDQDGFLRVWGENFRGNLGFGFTSGTRVTVPTKLMVLLAPVTTPISPASETTAGAWTTREYDLASLQPGFAATLTVTGAARALEASSVVVNQAWFTGAHAARTTPTAPAVPTLATVDRLGVAGNASCTADPTPGAEDGCDQVPAVIAAVGAGTTGTISGRVWDDRDGDGIRETGEPLLAGVPVALVRTSDSAVFGEAVTNASGAYSFSAVPASTNFSVRFDAVGRTGPGGGHYGFTAARAAGSTTGNDSDALATGLTPAFQVAGGATAANVDAGLVERSTAVTVTAAWGTGSPAEIPIVADGKSASQPVTITVTNSGDEALKDFTVDAVRIGAGADLDGLTCPSLTTTRNPGESFSCTATVPAMTASSAFASRVDVTAAGVSSSTLVGDDATISTLVADAAPGVSVTKYVDDTDPTAPTGQSADGQSSDAADSANPLRVRVAGPVASYRITNTGNAPLQGLIVTGPHTGEVTLSCVPAGSPTDPAQPVAAFEPLAPGAQVVCTAPEPDLPSGVPTDTAAELTAFYTGPTGDQAYTAYDTAWVVLADQGTVSGAVFDDLDDDGTRDVGELPLTGVKVTATNGTVTVQATTDVDGRYDFAGLALDTWTIDAPIEGKLAQANSAGATAASTTGSRQVTIEAAALNHPGVDLGFIMPPSLEMSAQVQGGATEAVVGATVVWEYLLMNTGPVNLTAIAVTRETGLPVACGSTLLEVGQTMTCTAQVTATSGP